MAIDGTRTTGYVIRPATRGSPDAGYGAPQGTFELTFDAWPPEGTVAQRWYFQTDGSMTADAPTDDVAASSFYFDPDAGHRGILDPGENSDDVWQSLPTYHWRQADPGSEVAFESAALTADEVMLGTGSADLWIRSHDPITDADLQVNLSEVRPDGQEMYIQSGWLRASFAALASTATALWPDHTFTETDVAPLVPETWTAVRVGIPSFNHVFRAGSKIRLTVNTPGGTRAAWTFDNTEYPDGTTYDVAHDAAHPSSLALPVLDGVASPTPLPPCPSLRGKQCRTYQAYTNVPAAP